VKKKRIQYSKKDKKKVSSKAKTKQKKKQAQIEKEQQVAKKPKSRIARAELEHLLHKDTEKYPILTMPLDEHGEDLILKEKETTNLQTGKVVNLPIQKQRALKNGISSDNNSVDTEHAQIKEEEQPVPDLSSSFVAENGFVTVEVSKSENGFVAEEPPQVNDFSDTGEQHLESDFLAATESIESENEDSGEDIIEGKEEDSGEDIIEGKEEDSGKDTVKGKEEDSGEEVLISKPVHKHIVNKHRIPKKTPKTRAKLFQKSRKKHKHRVFVVQEKPYNPFTEALTFEEEQDAKFWEVVQDKSYEILSEIKEQQRYVYWNYENPTPARKLDEALRVSCRWFIKILRFGTDTFSNWVRYFVREFNIRLLKRKLVVWNAVIVMGIVLFMSYSYMKVADIYADKMAIAEFGKEFQVVSEIHYELGDTIILDPAYFLDEASQEYSEKATIKSTLFDSTKYVYDEESKVIRGYGMGYMPCGTYTIQVCYESQVRACKIIVEDTTPPDLTNCDLYNSRYIKVVQGTSKVDIKGLLVAAVDDYSLYEWTGGVKDTSSLRVTTNVNSIDTSTKGSQTIQVTVEDKYGNKTEPFSVLVQVVSS
jgi:hypothetical protein